MDARLQRRVQRYGWDKAAEFYEDSWKAQLKPAQTKLMQMAALKPGEKVMETSCGTGLITFQAARAVSPGGEIMATDISDTMLELAKQRMDELQIHNITLRRMDAEELDLEDARFDAALCCLGLMYFPDPVQGLKEMFRVLKPGGRSVIAIWGERQNCGWAGIFPVVEKRVASDVCPMFFQQGTGKTLEYSMKTAGFSEISIERFSVELNYTSSESVIMAAFAGGPVALAYQKFDDQTKREAHQDYLDSIASFLHKNDYRIPGEFVVAKGVKP